MFPSDYRRPNKKKIQHEPKSAMKNKRNVYSEKDCSVRQFTCMSSHFAQLFIFPSAILSLSLYIVFVASIRLRRTELCVSHYIFGIASMRMYRNFFAVRFVDGRAQCVTEVSPKWMSFLHCKSYCGSNLSDSAPSTSTTDETATYRLRLFNAYVVLFAYMSLWACARVCVCVFKLECFECHFFSALCSAFSQLYRFIES